MKLNGQKHPQSLLMLAMILDTVNIMAWRQTENGVEGKNPPKSVYNILTGKEDTHSQNEYQTFDSGEEFEAARNEILRRGGYIQ